MGTRASDEQLMQRAIAPPRPLAVAPLRTLGWGASSRRRRATPSKARPSRRAVLTPRSWRCARPAHGPRARRSSRRSSPARITAGPRPASTRSSRRASPGSSSASKIPTPTSTARASRSCAPRASRCAPASCADEVRAQLAPYLKHRRTGRPYRRAQARRHARRAHRGTRWHEPVDHRRARTARCASAPGRERRGDRRRGHGASRRSDAHGSPCRRPRPGAGRARPRSRAREGASRARAPRRPRRRARRARPAGSRAGDGRGRRDRCRGLPSRGSRRSLRRCTSRPRCSVATTAGRCSPVRARRRIDDLWRGRLVSVDRLGDDIRLELEPA